MYQKVPPQQQEENQNQLRMIQEKKENSVASISRGQLKFSCQRSSENVSAGYNVETVERGEGGAP